MESTNSTKNQIQDCIKPNATQPTEPMSTEPRKNFFFRPCKSDIVPRVGPKIATRTVTREVA